MLIRALIMHEIMQSKHADYAIPWNQPKSRGTVHVRIYEGQPTGIVLAQKKDH